MVQLFCCFRKEVISENVKQELTMLPNNSTPGNSPKRNKSMCPHKDMYVKVLGILIDNRPKLETNHMSAKR